MDFLGTEPSGNTGAIKGHIAPAEHQYLFPNFHLFTEIHILEEIHTHQHPVLVGTRNWQFLTLMGTNGNKEGMVPLLKETIQRIHSRVSLYLNTHAFDL